MYECVVVGTVSQDVVLDVRTSTVYTKLGGTAANVAAALRDMGVSVRLFTRLGRDFDDSLLSSLDGVELHAERVEGSGPVIYGIDYGHEQSWSVFSTVFASPDPFLPFPRSRFYIFTTGHPWWSFNLFSLAPSSSFSIWNPGPDVPMYSHEEASYFMKRSNVVIFNSREYGQYVSQFGVVRRDSVVVTRGCSPVLLDGEEIPAGCVAGVSTIGAGDAFTANVAYSLMEGLPLREAVSRASSAVHAMLRRRLEHGIDNGRVLESGDHIMEAVGDDPRRLAGFLKERLFRNI